MKNLKLFERLISSGKRLSLRQLVWLRATTILLLVLALIGTSATAADMYWDINDTVAGSGATAPAGTWDNSSSRWNPDSAGSPSGTAAWNDANGDVAVFSAGSDATGTFTITLSDTRTAGGIRFEEGTVTISGGTEITLTGAGTMDVASSLTATIGSVIGGLVGLTKDNSGTLALSGDNTYTGVTTVSGGVLEVGDNNALGTAANGTTVSSGGTLRLQAINYSTTEALTLNGTGAGGIGALTTTGGSSTFAGQVTLATSSTINSGGGTLNLTGGVVKDGVTATFTGGGTININGVGIGGVSANSDLVVDGTTLVLNVANSYNGPTTVQNSGVLQLGASDVLPTSPQTALTLNTSGSFDMASRNDSVASLSGDSSGVVKNTIGASTSTLTISPASGSFTFAGTISGTAGGDIALVKTGAGTQVLGGSAANTYTGGTTLSQGHLELGKDNALGGSSSAFVFAGGVLDSADKSFSIGALSLTADSTLNLGTGATADLTFSSASWTAGVLTINNWTGTQGDTGSGSLNQIFISTPPAIDSDFLAHVQFNVGGDLYFGVMNGNELVAGLVAVPEPINVALGVFGVVFVGFGFARRLGKGKLNR